MQMKYKGYRLVVSLLKINKYNSKFFLYQIGVLNPLSAVEVIPNTTQYTFILFLYYIQHCFLCRPSDFTVPTDAGIEPRNVATCALTVRRSNH